MKLQRILENWSAKAICVIIATVLVFFTRLNSLKEEPVVVYLEVYTNSNYTFTNALPTRVTLKLRGSEDDISKVTLDDLGAYVDARDINKDGEYNLPIQVRDNSIPGTTDSLEISVYPLSITSKIEEKVTKYLRVNAVFTGIPAHGYEISSYFINPPVMSVTGPKSHLLSLETILTEPIDVTGKDIDFIQRIKLDRTDTLLGFPEGEFVEFKGIISETTAIKSIENVNIAPRGLKPSLTIVSELPRIAVTVEGKLLSLEDFTKNNISLTINLEDIESPGVYTVPVIHWTQRDFYVFNKSLNEITIQIEAAEEENPLVEDTQ